MGSLAGRLGGGAAAVDWSSPSLSKKLRNEALAPELLLRGMRRGGTALPSSPPPWPVAAVAPLLGWPSAKKFQTPGRQRFGEAGNGRALPLPCGPLLLGPLDDLIEEADLEHLQNEEVPADDAGRQRVRQRSGGNALQPDDVRMVQMAEHLGLDGQVDGAGEKGVVVLHDDVLEVLEDVARSGGRVGGGVGVGRRGGTAADGPGGRRRFVVEGHLTVGWLMGRRCCVPSLGLGLLLVAFLTVHVEIGAEVFVINIELGKRRMEHVRSGSIVGGTTTGTTDLLSPPLPPERRRQTGLPPVDRPLPRHQEGLVDVVEGTGPEEPADDDLVHVKGPDGEVASFPRPRIGLGVGVGVGIGVERPSRGRGAVAHTSVASGGGEGGGPLDLAGAAGVQVDVLLVAGLRLARQLRRGRLGPLRRDPRGIVDEGPVIMIVPCAVLLLEPGQFVGIVPRIAPGVARIGPLELGGFQEGLQVFGGRLADFGAGRVAQGGSAALLPHRRDGDVRREWDSVVVVVVVGLGVFDVAAGSIVVIPLGSAAVRMAVQLHWIIRSDGRLLLGGVECIIGGRVLVCATHCCWSSCCAMTVGIGVFQHFGSGQGRSVGLPHLD